MRVSVDIISVGTSTRNRQTTKSPQPRLPWACRLADAEWQAIAEPTEIAERIIPGHDDWILDT